MNKLYLFFSLILLSGLASANIVPIFQYNPSTNTITIIIPPQAGKSLNYGQNATYVFNDLVITNVTYGFVPNSVAYNLSGKTSQVVVTAPQSNQAQHTTFQCVNGGQGAEINNVSISCPAKINATVIITPSNANVTNTIIPQQNVSITGKALAIHSCTNYQFLNASWTNNVVIQNQTWPCNLNITVNKIKKVELFENATAPGNFINETLGIDINFTLPNRALRLQLPFGESYSIPGENSIITTENITAQILNFSNLNDAYNNRYLNNSTCTQNLTIGGTKFCAIEKSYPSNTINASGQLICDKQALIDHNVSLGYGNCIIQIAANATIKNNANYSQLSYQENQTNYWRNLYQNLNNSDHNGNSVLQTGINVVEIIVALFVAGAVIYLILSKKRESDMEKVGRSYERRQEPKKKGKLKQEDE